MKGIEIPVLRKDNKPGDRIVEVGLYSFFAEERVVDILDGFERERKKARIGKREWIWTRSSTDVAIIARTVGSWGIL